MSVFTLEESSASPQCNYCIQLRNSCFFISITSIAPILIFILILLLLAANNMEGELESTSYIIVCFVFILLYFQLFIGSVVLLIGFLKKRHPTVIYHILYTIFHVVVMSVFISSCYAITTLNEVWALNTVVLIGGGIYFALMYYYLMKNKLAWLSLRRLY